jgi:uncharacterized protein DUF6484
MRQVSEIVLEINQAGVEFEEPTNLSVKEESDELVLRGRTHGSIIPGVMVGTLIGFEEAGTPLVTFGHSRESCPVQARSTVELTVSQIGHEVALVFEQGDLAKPIILGCMLPQSPAKGEGKLEATLDGEHVFLSAERELVLRCGKSSITLTRAGKVIIRGAYLLSRSSGVNRIKGGSVQIN